MFQKFYPDLYVSSTYEIDFDRLYRSGYRGLIFDIDNTLVTHGAPANDQAKQLFAHLHEIGFATCLISNNQEPRVKPFADAVHSLYIYDAHKPSTKNYEKAMEQMHTRSDVYRCVWCQSDRNSIHNGKENPLEGRNSDCFKTAVGSHCADWLPQIQKDT